MQPDSLLLACTNAAMHQAGSGCHQLLFARQELPELSVKSQNGDRWQYISLPACQLAHLVPSATPLCCTRNFVIRLCSRQTVYQRLQTSEAPSSVFWANQSSSTGRYPLVSCTHTRAMSSRIHLLVTAALIVVTAGSANAAPVLGTGFVVAAEGATCQQTCTASSLTPAFLNNFYTDASTYLCAANVSGKAWIAGYQTAAPVCTTTYNSAVINATQYACLCLTSEQTPGLESSTGELVLSENSRAE
ncbi:hypothetical protein WJX79_003051 [Trebouxia sp. C0005]